MKLATCLAVLAAAVSSVTGEITSFYSTSTMVSPAAGGSDGGPAAVEVASIASPGAKDLIIFLSAEVELLTQTKATGYNGKGKDTSVAEASVTVLAKYMLESVFMGLARGAFCTTQACAACIADEEDNVFVAFPGNVTLSSRVQTLSVQTELDIKTKELESTDYIIDGYVSVDLELETTAAHSFNFIAPLNETTTGSNSNPIVVVACFNTDGSAEPVGSADYYAGLGKTMVIVQEAQSKVI